MGGECKLKVKHIEIPGYQTKGTITQKTKDKNKTKTIKKGDTNDRTT